MNKARAAFTTLAKENKDEPELYGQIGELYLQYRAYEDAIGYLETALKLKPELVYLYNSIGIALRKTGDFPTAEKYYLRAANYLGRDRISFSTWGVCIWIGNAGTRPSWPRPARSRSGRTLSRRKS